MDLMKAVVFRSPGVVEIEERKKPVPRAGQAVIRITTTTICGTDVHIVKGEYPVKPGLVLGHEPVGIRSAKGWTTSTSSANGSWSARSRRAASAFTA